MFYLIQTCYHYERRSMLHSCNSTKVLHVTLFKLITGQQARKSCWGTKPDTNWVGGGDTVLCI